MKSIGELFDLRHKKSLRLGVLLLSTLLIGSASALVYYSIQVRTTATTSAAAVKFVAGADSPAGYFINTPGTYARIAVNSYPNATVTYEKALNISNTGAGARLIRLSSVAISGGSTSYSNATSKIEFTLVNVAGTGQGTITYTGGASWTTTGSPTTYVSIPASTEWTIKIVLVANAVASTGVTTTIDIAVDVQ